jgi:AP-4 complex subunit sigma-1
MTIKFILLVNKQGQTRLSKYFTDTASSQAARLLSEAEVVRKCLKRTDKECNYVEHNGTRIVYRRYASLFFMVGIDEEENELAILEFIHCLVEAMDRWFGNVCELDIMFSLDMVRVV